MLDGKDPYIESAYHKLQIISQDKQKRMEYKARQKAILDHNQFLKEAEERGEKKASLSEKNVALNDSANYRNCCSKMPAMMILHFPPVMINFVKNQSNHTITAFFKSFLQKCGSLPIRNCSYGKGLGNAD